MTEEPKAFWPSTASGDGHAFCGETIDRHERPRRTAQRLLEIAADEGRPIDWALISEIKRFCADL